MLTPLLDGRLACSTDDCSTPARVGGMCRRCYARTWYHENRASKPQPDAVPSSCDRCAQQALPVRGGLCSDCRIVMTKLEREAWAA